MWLIEKDLVARGARISELLRPISVHRSGPAWARLQMGVSSIIIAAHDGTRPTSDYRDWRFSIRGRRAVGMYFEHWRLESRNRYVLEKAYLNLYKRIDSDERELVCLHCDPSLLENAEHARYKRGPHIHMSVAGSPYSHAHIALRGPDLRETLSSVDSIHAALTWGIEMIRDEMIGSI
jgi:hypothetical protein